MLTSRLHAAATLIVAVACLPAVAAEPATSVNWRTNLDQAKVEAAHSRKFLLVHFTTKTCGPCRLLDQHVFGQPHVGPALEQSFVPVRLDADENPAIAKMFQVDRVPAEFVVSPEGQILANPPIPNQPEAYLAQLQNIARHFQQAAAPVPLDVNAAYAGLPTTQQPAVAANNQAAPPQVVNNPLAQQQQAPPQTQMNPYASAAPEANRYGQAQSVYAAPAQAQPQQQVAGQPAATPNQAVAAQEPAMPSNAMPRSYRNPETGAGVAVTPPPAANVAAASGTSPAPATNPSAVDAAAAARPQLFAGSPPLGFDGFCPVSLKTLNRWTEGNSQFGAVHRGRTYLFAGAEQRDQFLANPDSFSPVFAGLDPVLLLDKQESKDGERKYGYRYGEAFYLFSSEETKQKFAASPQAYAAGVRQAMNRIDAVNGDTVRR